jgi:hypothetical protein
MRTVLEAIFASLICACAARAQEPAFVAPPADSGQPCAVSLFARPAFFLPVDLASVRETCAATSSAPLHGSQPPVPDPPPRPRRANRESDAFQIGLGYEFMRFRSAPFNANLSGLHTSFTYFPNDWLGFEGSVVAAFGSSTLNNESSRLVLYTAGPRIAWRRSGLQPWVHALAGGIHVHPQTAFGINGFALQLGGGADWLFKPLLSFRVESDYIRSQLYSSGQNSFQIGAGLVLHF